MEEPLRGHIVSMTEASNYGFIKGEDNVDYFFHKDDFIGFWNDLVIDYHHAPNPNIPVTFEKQEPTEKGPRAGNVKRTDFPNQAV
jgi:cold shock CspA family protein